MQVKIYQLNRSGMEKYGFMSYKFAQKHGFDLNDYEEKYVMLYAHVPCKENNYSVVITEEDKFRLLDKLFHKFNVERPDDFKGHSLSVSDLVLLGNEYYYCDDCGWGRV